MIIFYNKKTGQILHYIEGRVHDKIQLNCNVSNSGIDKNDVEKLIIGWEETDKIIIEQVVQEILVDRILKDDDGNDIMAKVSQKMRVPRERRETIEHNLDQFKILQKFEDNTPVNPFDYKIINNKLVKK